MTTIEELEKRVAKLEEHVSEMSGRSDDLAIYADGGPIDATLGAIASACRESLQREGERWRTLSL